MKKQSVLALLLGLTLLCTAIIPSVFAADGDSSGNGMVINKTATANNDGSYTIQLEAYATGSKIITEVTEDIPTDIVLVLDQSGSMDETMRTYAFREYTGKSNSDFYDLRHNGGDENLWYKAGDGKYYSVSVTVKEEVGYEELGSLKNYEASWGSPTTNCYYYYANNLYEKVGDEYKKVTLTYSGAWEGWNYVHTFAYTFSDGSTVISKGLDTQPDLGSHSPLYYSAVDDNLTEYTYTYTDADGETHTIGTSTGANTQPTNFTLYERYESGTVTRLNALKTAVTTFADSVAQKAKGADGEYGTGDDVNHRVAVVGFASGKYYDNRDYDYGNTEVFIGRNQYKYGTAAQGAYSSAFQSMNTTAGQTNVTASINALDADGGTLINLGMEMANGILTANPVSSGEKRNRVVIVFTDGQPGWSGYDSDTADAAIKQGRTIKNSGATVYTVGIFTGADATSEGNENGNDTQKANWFMQKLSSNNGTPQNPSYYLSAADADTLKNIFQQISDQIESGGSSTTLSSETVIKDIIAPAFTLPEGASASASDITLETYACTGKSDNGYTWSKNSDAMGATAEVDGDQVIVTGFNFADNYVGEIKENGTVTGYRGNKLVISFTVKPKSGFLGGNNVYTNTNAGVYENSSATEPVLTFDRPQVNVPIDPVTVTATDKNVYLLGSVTAEQLKEGTTVNVGDVELDLSKDNYGLEPWQTEYVKITVAIKEVSEVKSEDGTTTTTLTDWDDSKELKADATYQVSASVAPKEGKDGSGASGTPATAKSGSKQAKVNVFQPELTFKDSEVYYGDSVPTDYTGNKVSEVWKHGNTLSTAEGVTMLETAPELILSGTPDSIKIADGKINTKQDVPVDVTVKIGETDVTDKTTFAHNNCEGKTCTVPNGYEFLLHVKTCQLTVTKSGGVDGEPYVFTVKKDDVKYTEVTVVGNGSETICELPVGTYTIEEDTGWSWRFTPSYSSNVTLSKDNDNAAGRITCTNSTSSTKWLNGFSAVVTNIFGVKH